MRIQIVQSEYFFRVGRFRAARPGTVCGLSKAKSRTVGPIQIRVKIPSPVVPGARSKGCGRASTEIDPETKKTNGLVVHL
jgi:hypothetical protein